MLDDLDDIHPLFAGAPSTTEFKKLRKRIVRNVREAIEQFGMIERDARWLVCLSGGKDSYTLLAVLYELKWRGLLPVDILACNLDQGQPGFPATVLPEFFEKMGVPHRIEYQDTYSVVVDKVPEGRTFCALCSRLRRGHLYRIAREEGCSAVVLGHHRDDSNPDVISHLNKILYNELVAINQYFLHSKMYKDWGLTELAEHEYHESIDEMKHADELVERILFLEGIPNLQDLGKLRIGETPREMLECDLQLEHVAHEDLIAAIKCCHST